MQTRARKTAASLFAAGVLATSALAQPHPPPGHPIGQAPGHAEGRPPPFVQPAHPRPPPQQRPPQPPPHFRAPAQLDQRYRHDQYYPSHGAVFAALPPGSVRITYGGGHWFFHAGVFLRPEGPRYVVATPPRGIVVPMLPPAYVPLWIGGVPYYYANGIYYAAAPSGYAVVAPPAGVQGVQPSPVAPSFVIYPRNGQDPAQAEADRAACNQWASGQTSAVADYALFRRAFEACMDARGYTVR